MSKDRKLINRSAVRHALKDALRAWGHTRRNIPREVIDQVEASAKRLVTTIAAQGFK